MNDTAPPAGSGSRSTGQPVSAAWRERQRTRRAVAEAEALRSRLAAMEASLSWRLTAPLRRTSGARRLLRLLWLLATFRLAARLRARAASRERGSAPPAPADAAAAEQDRPCALLIDDHFPQPNRDAGSIEIMHLIDALLALGCQVTFLAAREASAETPDGAALAKQGVRCLASASDDWVAGVFLPAEGGTFDLCVLSRVYCGGRFLEAVQAQCPRAAIVFNTIDLHYVRIAREARLRDDAKLLAIAEQVRQREQHLARAADATIVVSAAEKALLAESVPDAAVVAMPLAREVRPHVAPFDQRRGIGFIGGFAHAPNIDAIRYFLAEIWPLVLRDLPDCGFTIVGADLPPAVLDGVPGQVRYLGHVPDVGPWFDGLRVTVAPLRFGAGLKGKVVSSLASGVPCVATRISVEGMEALDGVAVLVADTPQEFAANIVRASTDAALWSRLSAAGIGYVREDLSIAGWRKQLTDMLWTLGLLRGDAAAGRPRAPGAAYSSCR